MAKGTVALMLVQVDQAAIVGPSCLLQCQRKSPYLMPMAGIKQIGIVCSLLTPCRGKQL